MLTCRTVFSGESNVTNANTCFLQVRLTVSIVVTPRTTSRFRAAHGGIYYLQRLFEIIHMCLVWNLSYATSEARVIKFRILNLWIFDTSDLQWPETVKVTVGKILTLGYHGCLDWVYLGTIVGQGIKIIKKDSDSDSARQREAALFESWLTLNQD